MTYKVCVSHFSPLIFTEFALRAVLVSELWGRQMTKRERGPVYWPEEPEVKAAISQLVGGGENSESKVCTKQHSKHTEN